MWLRSLFDALNRPPAVGPAHPRRPRHHPPRLDALEDRRLLSFAYGGTYVSSGDYPYGLVAADVNADANLDLTVYSYTYVQPSPEEGGGGSIFYQDLLEGDGSGGFQVDWEVGSGTNSGGFSAGTIDFNHDGITDRLIDQVGVRDASDYNVFDGSSFSIQLGDGAGGFGAPRVIWVGNTSWVVPVAAGDFNRDGYTDLAVANCSGGYGHVDVLRNDAVWPPLPPPIPAIRIDDVAVTEGHTGTRAATFAVSLSIPSAQPVTVAYATANGTATAGTDYQSVSGTLTFAPGETTKTVSVPVIGDRLGEPDETFVVNLGNPTNSYVGDGQATGTIRDDEPRISITDVAKAEGKKGQTTLFVFTVTLSVAYDQPVTMSFATTDGSATASSGDYVARSGTLTFAPGETTKTITIEVKGDAKREYDEWFSVDLSGNTGNSLFTRSSGVGDILNDD